MKRLFFSLILWVTAANLLAQAPAQVTQWWMQQVAPVPGVAAWWRLDGNGAEATGAQAAGTFALTAQYESGVLARALCCYGTNYLIAAATPVANPTALTVSLWIKMKAGGATGVAFGHRSEATRLIQVTAQSDSEVRFQLRSDTSALVALAQTGLDLTKWTHVVAVFNKTGNAHALWINGVRRQTDTTAFGSQSFNSTLTTLGATFSTAYGTVLDGALDDVRIYNRVLTDAEIARLWNGGTGTHY